MCPGASEAADDELQPWRSRTGSESGWKGLMVSEISSCPLLQPGALQR